MLSTLKQLWQILAPREQRKAGSVLLLVSVIAAIEAVEAIKPIT